MIIFTKTKNSAQKLIPEDIQTYEKQIELAFKQINKHKNKQADKHMYVHILFLMYTNNNFTKGQTDLNI